MRLSHAVRVGAWVLVGLNVLMAVGTIAIFARMSPAIEVILDRNERSLQACEEMLTTLSMVSTKRPFTPKEIQSFRASFEDAQANITENQEPKPLQQLAFQENKLYQGDRNARITSIKAIIDLAQINRKAMFAADRHAQQLGTTGGWGVTFMALSAFLVGVIFIRNLSQRVVAPLEEIHTVLQANRNGETLRRCSGVHLAQDVATIYANLNALLDEKRASEYTPPFPPLPDGIQESAVNVATNNQTDKST
ncbi:hypothetical protein JWJ90_07165 [Desulfobulbus rhabdoformis]|uniref:hypothetical protein n=1 Tax=Desulfobulbus rhabdoformis TaxID=34032 RepID=UPI001965C362|nr:hypothetical protein [Desulfobulbus rhabdoformis]MBM9614064.1 hypothetical protein [Desulfobulbus rhabdoformis]